VVVPPETSAWSAISSGLWPVKKQAVPPKQLPGCDSASPSRVRCGLPRTHAPLRASPAISQPRSPSLKLSANTVWLPGSGIVEKVQVGLSGEVWAGSSTSKARTRHA